MASGMDADTVMRTIDRAIDRIAVWGECDATTVALGICAIKSAPDPRVRFAGQSGHPSPRATSWPGATGCSPAATGAEALLWREESARWGRKRGDKASQA